MAQPSVQMVNMQPRPTALNPAPNQAPNVAPSQSQAAHQQPQAPKSPLLRYIRFFACWECGPIGTIIAVTAFATATVFTYQALKLAIWTATKDYIEHCQSDVLENGYQPPYRETNLADSRPIFEEADIENICATPEHPRRVVFHRLNRDENIDSAHPAISTGATVNTGYNSQLTLRHRGKKPVDIAPGLLEENPSCLMAKDSISVLTTWKARGGRVGEQDLSPFAAATFDERGATISQRKHDFV
ncbi:hypothetical protein IFR05_013467 [Cadophora sp. M221]|nr:hypothetical protein IFR05_013467 [Cadophora sp. M221]